MRKIFFTSLFIFNTFLLFSSEFTFRKTFWGATREQVKASEKAEFFGEDEENLVYKDTLSGFSVAVIYNFINDTLTSSFYILEDSHYDGGAYYEDYKNLKNILNKKYGGGKETEHWSSNEERYKGNDEKYGLCINLEFLSLSTLWEDSKNYITLSVMKNDDILVTINYEPKDEKFKKLIEDNKNKEIEDNF